jgi:hypothetical protein
MTTANRLRTLGDVRHRHSGHWFDADTMRFFRCRLPDDYTPLIGGRYFISSEKHETPGYPSGPRLYTIREAFSNGAVDTVGEFQGYETRRAAERAAHELPTDYSAALMAVLESELHNRTGWIKRASQLAKYTGKPIEDCREVIAARAKARRRARAKTAA